MRMAGERASECLREQARCEREERVSKRGARKHTKEVREKRDRDRREIEQTRERDVREHMRE